MRMAMIVLVSATILAAFAGTAAAEPATQPSTKPTTRPLSSAKEAGAWLNLSKLASVTDEVIREKNGELAAKVGLRTDVKVQAHDTTKVMYGAGWRFVGYDQLKFPDGTLGISWDVELPSDQKPPARGTSVRCRGEISQLQLNWANPAADRAKNRDLNLRIYFKMDDAKKKE